MPRLEFSDGVYDDVDRFVDHMRRVQVVDPVAEGIIQAVQILTYSPLIGRRVAGGKRELVIGSDEHGYVALYRFSPRQDAVSVVAIRSQSERGYRARN